MDAVAKWYCLHDFDETRKYSWWEGVQFVRYMRILYYCEGLFAMNTTQIVEEELCLYLFACKELSICAPIQGG